jgi:hypothetical protein
VTSDGIAHEVVVNHINESEIKVADIPSRHVASCGFA